MSQVKTKACCLWSLINCLTGVYVHPRENSYTCCRAQRTLSLHSQSTVMSNSWDLVWSFKLFILNSVFKLWSWKMQTYFCILSPLYIKMSKCHLFPESFSGVMLTSGCMIKLQMTGLFMPCSQENNVNDALIWRAGTFWHLLKLNVSLLFLDEFEK